MPAVERPGATIGAYIQNTDLTSLSQDDIDTIKGALTEHLVLFFRDQHLDPPGLHRLATQFGKPTPYPYIEGLPDYPDVVEVIKRPEDTINFGGIWHSDTAYLNEPAMAGLLYGLEIPPEGGDTLFANMYQVYDSLSPGMQRFLQKLTAINDADNEAIVATRPGKARKAMTAEHPVVRRHPVTGRPLLYVNRAHTTRFAGMTRQESQGLLEFLFARIEQPEFSCRFHWQAGSLAFWDNRVCQHYPINDYHGSQRRMLRISLAGDRPRHYSAESSS